MERRCANCREPFVVRSANHAYCQPRCVVAAKSRRVYRRRVERGWKKGPGATGWIRQEVAA